MLTLSLITPAAIALIVGIVLGAVIRVDCNAEAEVRVAFSLLLMLCISSMVMLSGVTIETLATYFIVSTVVAITLQFMPENSMFRRIAKTLG